MVNLEPAKPTPPQGKVSNSHAVQVVVLGDEKFEVQNKDPPKPKCKHCGSSRVDVSVAHKDISLMWKCRQCDRYTDVPCKLDPDPKKQAPLVLAGPVDLEYHKPHYEAQCPWCHNIGTYLCSFTSDGVERHQRYCTRCLLKYSHSKVKCTWCRAVTDVICDKLVNGKKVLRCGKCDNHMPTE